ncbi:MAG TPA: amino acid ABC transporter permease [Pseudonocardia sp.]|jgi:polar amino acid transport system permease protein|nr:amino acid ABC transporter permease [Pseudonocardia sp.]
MTAARTPIDLALLTEISDTPPVRRRRPGETALVALIAVLAVCTVAILVTNPRFDWPTVGSYLFDVNVAHGIAVTLELTVYAMAVGILLGVVLAVLRQSGSPVARGAAWLYIWFFRGTPVLVQVLFWGFASALFPQIGLGIPGGPMLFGVDTNTVVPLFAAAVLGLGLNEAAYMAEIVRGGLLSVSPGQAEAAHALGLGSLATLRHVVLPQALRVIIPPVGNQVISMLKMTSVVLVIGVRDLLGSVTEIYSRNYRQIALLIVACFWYLLMTSVLTYLQSRLERRLGKGVRTDAR